MITDNGLRLATAEALASQNNGVLTTRTIGADSSVLGPNSVGLDEAGLTEVLNFGRDIGSGQLLSMVVDFDTAPKAGTNWDSTLEIQLISLPVNKSQLTAAAGEGFLHRKTGLSTDISGHVDGESVVIMTAHGLALGTPIFLEAIGGTTAGIVTDRVYYVVPTGANTFQLATTLANATASPAVIVTMTVADGTVDVEFIATVHATTGTIRLFDEIGAPAVAGGQAVANHRIICPTMPLTAKSGKRHRPKGQTVDKPYGVSGDLNLVGVTPQRFYYLSYVSSATMTAGSVTVDLVLSGAEGNPAGYTPSGYVVIG